LLGLQGGVIADRFSKRKLILATQVTMGLIALALAAAGPGWCRHFVRRVPLRVPARVVTAVDNPTRQAFVSELVGGEELPECRRPEQWPLSTPRASSGPQPRAC